MRGDNDNDTRGDGGVPIAHRAEPGDPEAEREVGAPRLVVGLGASAGGLAALEAFLDGTPPHTGMAFVVVSHQYPRAESLMPELLQKHTQMPVHTAADGMRLAPDHVYVAPPQGFLTLEGDVLRLSEPDPGVRRHLPIDRFFRSLGEAKGERAACVVLSGSGTDGTVGLKVLKSELGLAIAQDPDTAGYPGMPASAIGTRQVDHVLSPGDMARALDDYADALRRPRLAPDDETTAAEPAKRASSDVVGQILRVVRARTGHDLSAYKPSTVGRRIDRRMAVHRMTDPQQYLEHLRTAPAEVDVLFHELLIGVTSFFRDPEAFEALAREALPRLIGSKPASVPLRVWVAGCSTGEEAYSVAIALRECMDAFEQRPEVQIFATDIDDNAIRTARLGVYPAGIAEDVGPERLSRFFVAENSHYRVGKELRDMVVFAVQNVLSDPPFTRLDLLCCRNLLIYLDTAVQADLLPMFHYALAPQGILFIGTAETLADAAEDFEVVDKRWNLFRRKDRTGAGRMTHLPRAFEPRGAGEPRRAPRPGGIADMSERILTETVVPPSLIVDEHGEIQHLHGRTGRFLEPSPGDPGMNLFRMAREGLRTEAISALRQAAADEAPVARRGLRVQTNGETASVDLHVRPVRQPKAATGHYVVTFEEAAGADDAAETAEAAGEASEARADEIERELRATKETLQSTIEEYETANEELRSSNEELQSTNEELQSTNEELETSKEEQQSLNEELQTVNAELQDKMEHLGRAHDDMQNLLNSTEIATLFLDKSLKIKRFTEQARRVANLIETDVGRPISDLVTKLDYDTLAGDARAVLDTLQPRQTEVRAADGTLYQMSIAPYRTSDDVIDGVVLTFVDVTRLKEAERDRERERAAVRHVVEAMPVPALVLDRGLRVALVNERFLTHIGMDRARAEGKDLADLGKAWEGADVRAWLGGELPGGGEAEPLRIEADGHRALELTARRMDGPDDDETEGERILLTLRERDAT